MIQRQLLKALAIIGIVLALGAFVKVTSTPAMASYAFKDALITVGLGTAAGTVLGASSLPFYGYPEDHLDNVLIGAGIGLVAGIGVALYLITTPDIESTHRPVSGTDPLVVPQNVKEKFSSMKPRSSYGETRVARVTNPGAFAMSLNLFALAF